MRNVEGDLRTERGEAGASQDQEEIAGAIARQRVAQDASAWKRWIECGTCIVAHVGAEPNRAMWLSGAIPDTRRVPHSRPGSTAFSGR